MGLDVRRVPSRAERVAGLHPDRDGGSAWQVRESATLTKAPRSPVFEDRAELIEWLVKDGRGIGLGGTTFRMTRSAAERFVNARHAVTFSIHDGRVWSGLADFEEPS